MIVFINCYEAMNTGMRMLAHMAKNKSFDVHLIVMNDYKVGISVQSFDEETTEMHVLMNSNLHCRTKENYFLGDKELELLQEKLKALNPELICISSRSNNDRVMPSLIKAIKKSSNAPIVCGGYGPTYNAKHYLENGADVVLRGEGEISFPALLDNFKNNLPLYDAPNTSWLENGILKENPLAPPMKDFTANPSPLIDNSITSYIHDDICEEIDPSHGSRIHGYYRILIGRGCLGTCSYCAAPVLDNFYKEQGLTPAKYRRRLYSQIFEELEEAKKHGAEEIFIRDDYFVDTTQNLISFFNEYKERIKLPFKAHFHSSQFYRHPELRKAALDAGLSSYTIGFQGGNEDIARNVYDRPHPFAELKELGDILFDDLLSIQYHFVSGTTINTDEEFKDKCALIASLPYDPLDPLRTLIFDFRFFPQPLSKLTKELGKSLRQLSINEWANSALRAQLRQFLKEEDCLILEDKSKKEKDANIFLLKESANIRHTQQQEKLLEILNPLEGKEILVMGDKSPTFINLQNAFSKIKIVGNVGFPHINHKGTDRIEPTSIKDNFSSDIPLFIFGQKALAFTRYMRSLGLENKIHHISTAQMPSEVQ